MFFGIAAQCGWAEHPVNLLGSGGAISNQSYTLLRVSRERVDYNQSIFLRRLFSQRAESEDLTGAAGWDGSTDRAHSWLDALPWAWLSARRFRRSRRRGARHRQSHAPALNVPMPQSERTWRAFNSAPTPRCPLPARTREPGAFWYLTPPREKFSTPAILTGIFMPASNAKLFTTALALASLGPDYRVRTTVASSGAIDANGVLGGDLVLIGRGDANLSSRKFPFEKKEERDGPPEKVLAEFAAAVAARGVKEITGDVVADDSFFQHEIIPSGWLVDDILWSYGAAVSAISVNDNVFTLDIRPGLRDGDPARYDAGIAGDFYTVENMVLTSARGTEQNLAVARDPGSRLIHVSGTVPVDAPVRRLTIAVEEPAEYAAAILKRLLEAHGVKVDGISRAHHAGGPPQENARAANHSCRADFCAARGRCSPDQQEERKSARRVAAVAGGA